MTVPDVNRVRHVSRIASRRCAPQSLASLVLPDVRKELGVSATSNCDDCDVQRLYVARSSPISFPDLHCSLLPRIGIPELAANFQAGMKVAV